MGVRLYISKFVESCGNGLKNYFTDITLEKAAFLMCFTFGLVFLFIALFGPWRYYLLAAICFISAFIVTEEREH